MSVAVPSEDRKVFAENLKNLLFKNGMEQRDLAARMKVSISIVNYWVNAQSYPRTKMMGRIAEIFGVTIEELTTPHEEKVKRSNEEEMLLERISKLDKEEIEALKIIIESMTMQK